MAYQDWFTRSSRTANAVGSDLPPALIPANNSVLNEQPVPKTYTTNMASGNMAHGQAKNTPISNVSQINQIMNSINPQAGAGNLWSNTCGGGGGGAPTSWNTYSSGGSTGPSNPWAGTNNPGVTQTYHPGPDENTSVSYSENPTYTTPYFGGSTTTDLSWGPATQEDYGNLLNSVMNTVQGIFPGGSGGYQGSEGLGYTSLADSQAATDYENVSNAVGWINNPLGSLIGLFNQN